MVEDIFFNVQTPLGFSVWVTYSYWNVITTIKHPVMKGREVEVQETLMLPEEVRRSRNDPDVYIFYKLERPRRWICAVAKRLNGSGFLITTFPTDAIKMGEFVWSK